MPNPSIVALIPARAESKRVPGKNTRLLGGHPLLAWSIATARESGIFGEIVVSTESAEIADMAERYGAYTIERPAAFATDTSPDIEWVRHAMATVDYAAFAILRPTSPFRTAETIRFAWTMLQGDTAHADSIRAVEKCGQHPYKMWTVNKQRDRIIPLHPAARGEHPWHSSQYQALPEIYVQNSSLEIAWTRVLDGDQAQAGNIVMPFFTDGYEGLAIDYPRDFEYAELLLSQGKVTLPQLLAGHKKPVEIPHYNEA